MSTELKELTKEQKLKQKKGNFFMSTGLKELTKEQKLKQKIESLKGVQYIGYGSTDENAPLGYITGTNIPRTRRKVSIVGFAPSSMQDVQFVWDDPDMEVWSINQLYMAFEPIVNKTTRWFQIHHRHSYDQTVNRDHSHHMWLTKQNTFPIYMQNKELDVPSSVEFPKKLIMDTFGGYFTNSISWEIALAIYEGFEKIYLFGIDMAQDSEYSFERPSVEFFLGWACGRNPNGLNSIVVPEKSDLLKTMWLYPFDDSAPFRAKCTSRLEELNQRIGSHSNAEFQNRDIKNQLLGAQDNMRYIMKTWEQSSREIATIDNRITKCPYCDGNHDFRITACENKKE